MKIFLKAILVLTVYMVTVNLCYAQSIQKVNQSLKIEKLTGPQALIQDSPYSINPVGQNQFKAFTSILTQDFSTVTFPPTGWTRTVISGPLNWSRGTSLTLSYNTLSSLGSTFSNGYAIANSDGLGGAGPAENCVLTSPVMNCTGKPYVWLKFNEFFRLLTVGSSTGHVEVSNNGSTWTTVHSAETGLIANQSTPNPNFVDVDISSVAANQATVYVRFHWTGNWDYYWVVDDVEVYCRPQYDATFSARTNMNEYSSVPLVQYNNAPVALAATARNVGGATLTGVNMGVTVYNGYTWSPLYTATSNTVASVAANATGSLSVANYTPPAGLGFYVGEYVVHSQQTDADILNDTLQQGFWINGSIYSRDDAIFTGMIDGSLGITAHQCIMGQNYQVLVNDKLKSVSCYVTGAVTGDQTQIVVYNTSSNLPTTQIASSLLYTFPTTAAQWVNLPISGGPLTLTPGTYFIGIRQISTVNNLGLGYTDNNFTSNKVYVKIDTDPWDSLSLFGYSVSFVVRPIVGTMQIVITTHKANCNQSNGWAEASITGGSAPYHILWSNGDTTIIADSLSAGTYSLLVTDYNGMNNLDYFVINNTGGFAISGTTQNVHCGGGSDGAIDLTITGGTGPFVVNWSNGASTQDIGGLTAGTYDVNITDAIGCVGFASFNILDGANITFTNINTDPGCGLINGSISITPSGGTGPYTYAWSSGQSTATISGVGAGYYGVTITDINLCSVIGNISLNNSSAPVITIDSVQSAPCGGSGAAYITVTGGALPLTYNWSNSFTGEDLVGVIPGNYTVTVTDNGTCIVVTQVEIPTDLLPVQPICMITVDSLISRNKIVWAKVSPSGVDYYKIYRESSTPGQYLFVDTVRNTSMSKFTDSIANPMTHSWRYKISQVDMCGNESPLSDFHKTMHLTINHGLGNSFNLIWDDYEGYYYPMFYIIRHINALGWVTLDSLQNTMHSYTDNPPSLGGLKYLIGIKKTDSCIVSISKDQTETYNTSVSNMEEYAIIIGVEEIKSNLYGLDIYPNPNSGVFSLVHSDKISNVFVYDIYGSIIYEKQKINSSHFDIDLKGMPKGIYFIKVQSGNNVYTDKVIVE